MERLTHTHRGSGCLHRLTLNSRRRALIIAIMRDSHRASSKDRGTALVLLTRLNERRLPFALDLKAKVDRGERLSDYDSRFLKRVLAEAGEAKRLAQRLPQYQEIVDKMTSLYAEITRKGLENEHKPLPEKKDEDE